MFFLGIVCQDGDIFVTDNHWMDFDGDAIISAVCASSFCCQLDRGCNYVEDTDSLCADNRNSSSTLCSLCNDGYSEYVIFEWCHAHTFCVWCHDLDTFSVTQCFSSLQINEFRKLYEMQQGSPLGVPVASTGHGVGYFDILFVYNNADKGGPLKTPKGKISEYIGDGE